MEEATAASRCRPDWDATEGVNVGSDGRLGGVEVHVPGWGNNRMAVKGGDNPVCVDTAVR